MKLKQFFALILIVLSFQSGAFASWFHPQLSILGAYTHTQNNSKINSGAFDIHSRKINFGLECINKFYFKQSFFIASGIRYNQYRTFINGKNQIEGLFDKPYPLRWTRGYESVAVPILFGKTLRSPEKNKVEVYLGASAGILMTSAAKTEMESDFARNINYNDLIQGEIRDDQEDLPAFFYLTADIGASYQPVRSIPNFTIGILCSVQLTQTDPYTYHGVITNLTQGTEYIYDLQHHQKFINCALTLSYTFGRHHPVAPKTNCLNCPK
jgi:hypothetical protein